MGIVDGLKCMEKTVEMILVQLIWFLAKSLV